MTTKHSSSLVPSRRQLLWGSLALTGLGLSGCATMQDKMAGVVPGTTKRRTGIQLYTVRSGMEQDLPGTLQALSNIGYKELEFAGYFGRDPKDIRMMLDDMGMTAPSAHMPFNELRANHMPMLEQAKTVGHDYVTVPWLFPDDRKTIDQYKQWAADCNRIGEDCRKMGMGLAYHNHDFELTPINGTLPYDILMDETDPALVDFELDLYWVRKAGYDIQTILRKNPDRFVMCHVKDMDTAGNMADVGSGTIDFASVFADRSLSKFKHFFVERDDSPDPFKTAAISHGSLENIFRSLPTFG